MIEPVYHAAASEKLLVTILRTGAGEEGAVTPDHTLLDQIVQRLNARLLNTKSILPEHIVLIRQAVRWSGKNIFVGKIHPTFADLLHLSSLSMNSVGELVSDNYRPTWISEERWDVVDTLDLSPVYSKPDEQIPAEPWMRLLNLKHWNSPAQKEACWTALTATNGSTTLITLPTGAGKSLCFQLLSVASSGLTLVVVPTTALAIDQYLSSKSLLDECFPTINPLYYVADDPNLPVETVRQEVQNGSCRLLFTSPEAFVSGSLKKIIFKLSEAGHLSNLVIDEAHIIESWGRHFRVDFQFLSAVRKQLLTNTLGRLRTFLLSATFTETAIKNLQTMFSEEGGWQEFTSQRLRPELRFFNAKFLDEDRRREALLDAVRHLPRPLIIYVTKKEDCEAIYNFLIDNGFMHIDYFHGDTNKLERRRILESWHEEKTDIIVATSAFGMGVDKQNVRTIIHACFPESMDRFYQEVGRGGRDGYSAISLWLPCLPSDRHTALGIRPKVLTDEDKIEKRWTALLNDAEWDTQHSKLILRMDTKREDFWSKQTGSKDKNWNKSLILMFVPLKIFTLLNVSRVQAVPERGEVDDYDLVEIEYHLSPTSPDFLKNLEIHIAQIRKQSQQDFSLLDQVIDNQVKMCRALRRVYGSNTITVCSGSICASCRDEEFNIIEVPKLSFERDELLRCEHEILTLPTNWHSDQFNRYFEDLFADLIEWGVDAFVIADSLIDRANEVIEREFPRDFGKLYRIENELNGGILRHKSGDRVVWFHDKNFDRETVNKNIGSIVTHVIPNDVDLLDHNNRPFFSHMEVRHFNDLYNWKGSL
jgi:ATP-dependent DNA helicase RecQ